MDQKYRQSVCKPLFINIYVTHLMNTFAIQTILYAPASRTPSRLQTILQATVHDLSGGVFLHGGQDVLVQPPVAYLLMIALYANKLRKSPESGVWRSVGERYALTTVKDKCV